MSSGLHVKYLLFFSDFNKTRIFRQIFEKHLNVKFHENPSTGSRVVPCGITKTCTDFTKLIVVFQNFENAPKNGNFAAYIKKRKVYLMPKHAKLFFGNRCMCDICILDGRFQREWNQSIVFSLQ